jgi:hypothetical protein
VVVLALASGCDPVLIPVGPEGPFPEPAIDFGPHFVLYLFWHVSSSLSLADGLHPPYRLSLRPPRRISPL